ncbi:hypothetical protein [Rathayibacter festucae]|uniref:hypothetical protein n=1 Tax=Rathayibacter festucae TaxID=110937 RepID=UPI002A6B538B|nr:hypothetical protein [Rathayibacter festucae]MDY0911426.1 hypothetical protein [Rathayibacter festucae]
MNRLRPSSAGARSLLLDAVAGLLVAAATLATIGALLGTGWRVYFLRDGDSLALPMMMESLRSGEPLQWVMTSQLFFFPELPLYALSSLAGSVQAALLLNGVLNVVLLFVIARGVAALVLADRAPWLRRIAAVAVCVLFLLLCLSETRALNNDGALAPTFLLTTYYHGSVLVALGCAALTLRSIGGAASRVGTLLAPALVVLLSAATTLSNPLFLFHFTVPAVIALLSLRLTAQLRTRPALTLLGAAVGGSALGFLARIPLSSFIATDPSSYIDSPLAGAALTRLMEQIADVKSTPAGLAELAVLAGLLVAAALIVLARLHRLVRPRPEPEALSALHARSWFLCVFAAAQVVVLLSVQLATGSTVTRYLMPLAVTLCLLAPVVLAAVLRRRDPRPTARAVTAVTVTAAIGASLLLGGAGAAASVRAVEAEDPAGPSASCIEDWVGGRDIAGVASFWISRPLALYGGLDVQQVNTDFSVQVWMSNLTWYDDEDFSFVLVDPTTQWPDFAEASFGPPASVVDCGEVDILDYSGTPGEAKLDEVISTSVGKARQIYGY